MLCSSMDHLVPVASAAEAAATSVSAAAEAAATSVSAAAEAAATESSSAYVGMVYVLVHMSCLRHCFLC